MYDDIARQDAPLNQAMIFAAGLGTRLRPLTDTMPKALVRVGGQPLLGHVIEKLRRAGFERLVVNVHHFAEQIVDYLEAHDRFGLDIRVSDETEGLLETGGGIKHARPFFDVSRPVLIHNVDILSNVDLRSFYQVCTDEACLLVSERETKRYLLFDDDMRLVGWTNRETGEVRSPYAHLDVAACHAYAFSGIHAIGSYLLAMMDEWPERFGIIDFYLGICDKVAVRGIMKPDLQLMDVGKQDTLAQAEGFLARMGAPAEP